MIRLLTAEDSKAYYKVIHEGYKAIVESGIDFSAATATIEELEHWLAVNPTYGLFIDDGSLVSVISLRMPWGPNAGPRVTPHLGQISTLPEYKHKGYSSKLFSWLEDNVFSKELKVSEVTLGTAAEHPWLIGMYEKWGFSVFGTKHIAGKLHQTVYLHKRYEL